MLSQWTKAHPISCHKQLLTAWPLLNNQTVRRPDVIGTANPDVLFTLCVYLPINTIILQDSELVGGGKGNVGYLQRDLQLLQSLEKRRIQLCCENKPKGSGVQRGRGPVRTPRGSEQTVGSRRKLYHKAEGACRPVCLAINPSAF